MGNTEIVDEDTIRHSKTSKELHIALTETKPDYTPRSVRSDKDIHHVTVSVRPSKEFCVWSVEQVYEGIDPPSASTVCEYCESEGECHLLKGVILPGIKGSQKDLLTSENLYKTERVTTALCPDCFREIKSNIEDLVKRNNSEITISNL